MMRRMTNIVLVALLVLGSMYNTGLRLGFVNVAPDTDASYRLAVHQHCKAAAESLEKIKPKIKVRYRASEVKPDLFPTNYINFRKPVFYTNQVFFDNYSFHTLSYHHAIKLRGPPAGRTC